MKHYLILIGLFFPVLIYGQMENSIRYQRGWHNLQTIDAEAGEKVVQGLRDISPDLSRFILEYCFGDVYQQENLSNKYKEIVAVASLIAQRAVPELKVHLHGALNTGNTINEVKEVILQMSVYVGFPKCITAMKALEEVLAERLAQGITDEEGKAYPLSNEVDRLALGAAELAKLDPTQLNQLKAQLNDVSPELVQFILEYAYGDIYARDNLDKKSRQLATISALTTLGNAPAQLKFHIQAGLKIGLEVREIKDAMLLLTVYAGFPAAINGTNALIEITASDKAR